MNVSSAASKLGHGALAVVFALSLTAPPLPFLLPGLTSQAFAEETSHEPQLTPDGQQSPAYDANGAAAQTDQEPEGEASSKNEDVGPAQALEPQTPSAQEGIESSRAPLPTEESVGTLQQRAAQPNGGATQKDVAGPFTITGGTAGIDYSYDSGVLTIKSGAVLTISSTATSDRIVVASSVGASLTLAGVDITSTSGSSLELGDAAASSITVAAGSTNKLDAGGSGEAGILTPRNGALLTITCDGTLNAIGGGYAAGIGGNAKQDGGNITFAASSKGTVNATSNGNGAGIGGGSGTGPHGSGGIGGTIRIEGGTINAESKGRGAGIGGGRGVGAIGGPGGTITITGGTVHAKSGDHGAGIGGGGSSGTEGGPGGTITITGGTVHAEGGNLGAGIGGGGADFSYAGATGGPGGIITITGGTIYATGVGTDGIGHGMGQTGWYYYPGGNGYFYAEDPYTHQGNAFIVANGISDTAGKDAGTWRGVIFEGDSGTVYGSRALSTDLTIPSGKTLTVPSGNTLTVPSGLSLVVDGAVYNKGGIANDGTLDGTGTVNNDGGITGAGSIGGGLDIVNVPAGGFSVSGGVLGRDFSFADNVLTVLTDVSLTIANVHPQTATADRIKVRRGTTANVALKGVNVDVHSTDGACALEVPSGSTLNLALEDGNESSLRSGSGRAGLEAGAGAALSISGSGSLSATGGPSAAGIGGRSGGSGGVITVSGGTVTAVGDSGAAGIGAGAGGTGGTFKTAGEGGSSGNAFILASSISDKSGSEPDARNPWSGVIFQGDAGKVYGDYALSTDAAVPSGKTLTVPAGKTLTVPVGKALAVASGATLAVDGAVDNKGGIANDGGITGTGTVNNDGGITGSGRIGSSLDIANGPAGGFSVTGGVLGRDYSFADRVLAVLTDVPLTIANVHPDSPTADCIAVKDDATANVELAGVNVDVSSYSNTSALEVPEGATLNLTLAEGSENSLRSSLGRAGLEAGEGAALSISGSGSLRAFGGDVAAGIGGAYDSAGGTVTIKSGSVSAIGGNAAYGYGGGVGIGGGYFGGGGTVSVSGGAVTAVGGSGAAGIGAGARGSGGTFGTTSAGSAFVLASSISDTSGSEPGASSPWSGVIFQGDAGKVYGKPTLALSAAIPTGKTLDVPAGSSISLGSGVTLTNDGTIENHGGIAGSNSIDGNGKVISDAKVVLKADPTSARYGDPVVLTATVSQAAPTPGTGAANPTGEVTFAVVKGGDTTPLGDPVVLAPDPSDPGAALATLKVKALGDDWAIGANDLKASYSGQAAATGAPGLAQAYGHLSLKVEKGEIHPSVSIAGWTYGQPPSRPSVDAATNPGGGAVSYAYKPLNAPDTSYKAEAPTAAGSYTLRATVGETERYAEGEARADFAIAKAGQAAPANLAGDPESVSGKGGGTIGGLTTAMEWASTEGGTYKLVTDPNMSFKPGTYWVRLAADADHDASPAAKIVVARGPKLKVTLPAEQVGYALTADKNALDWHEPATLTFKLASGYTKGPGFAVKAAGATISSGPDGSYALSDAERNVSVTVEGVVDTTAPAVSSALGAETWSGFKADPGTAPALAGAQTLTVKASDSGSGLGQVDYLLSDTPFASIGDIQGEWKPVAMDAGKGAIALQSPGASYVYVKATDKDGNFSVAVTPRIVRYEQPILSPSSTAFDPASPADVAVQMTLNGNKLAGVSAGGHELTKGKDYEVAGSKVTVKASYLLEQAKTVRSLDLAFSFDPAGVAGTTPRPTATLKVALGKVPIAPEFMQQTVYDDAHDASLSGMLASGATFSAAPLAQGDEAYDALSRTALAAGQDVVGAYEAKLIGKYEGKLRISFKVGGTYEGKTLTVYHRKDVGGIETLASAVKDGWATVEVDGLSPFLVTAPSAPGTPAPQPGAPDDQDAATLAPQTGDGLPLASLALAVLLSGAALVALAVRKARSRRSQ